jgi:translation initiation factor 2B subunit (eIF-2B alpha/beta/delta family)
MALLQALAAGRRFEVVCSESRPMREGLVLAKQLADSGIPVHLVADAALPEWTEKADLVLVGADAVVREGIVNKIGTRPLVWASRRASIPVFVLADSHKWLTPTLQGFCHVREESPREITTMRHTNLQIHNRYFDVTPYGPFSGMVWEGGIMAPGEARQMIARLPVSEALVGILQRQFGMGRRSRR